MPASDLHSQIHLIVYESEYRTRERVQWFCRNPGFGHVVIASREIGDKEKKPHYHIALVLNAAMRDKALRDRIRQAFKREDEQVKSNACYSVRAWDTFKQDYNLEQYIAKGMSADDDPDIVFQISDYENIVMINGYESKPDHDHHFQFWAQRAEHKKAAEKAVKEKASLAAQKTKEVISKVLADIKEQYDTTPQIAILERVISEYKGSADDRTVGLTTQKIFFITDRTQCIKQQRDRVWSRFFCQV